jgi:DNA-binding Xre family transcriptional regulator
MEDTGEPLQMGLNIKTIRELRKMPKTVLADKAHLSRSKLDIIESGGNCETNSLVKICRVFEMRFYEVAAFHITGKPINS